MASGLEPVDWSYRPHYFLWIAIAHGAQYLWVTAYFARRSPGWHGLGPYLAKVLLCGVAIWLLPQVIFAPDALGTFSYSDGLFLLVATAVNLHHFILDGAIWKLRSTRVANVLLRSAPAPEPAPVEPSAWPRRVVWGSCCIGLAAGFFGFWAADVRLPTALQRGDVAEARTLLDRLAWVGRDDWNQRLELARGYRRTADLNEAKRQYQRILALREDAAVYSELGHIHQQQGDWTAALDAYERGLQLRPERIAILERAANAAEHVGRPERARELRERLARLNQPPGRDADLPSVQVGY